MYTIGQISKMFGLPASTLRYYDKEGLLPHVQRRSGIRRFSEEDIETLRVIECLKIAGMEIKDIKTFIGWCAEGPSTYRKRKKMFENQKAVLEEKMRELEKSMAMIDFKNWYYEKAIADGSEDGIAQMIPDGLPPDIRSRYEKSHGAGPVPAP